MDGRPLATANKARQPAVQASLGPHLAVLVGYLLLTLVMTWPLAVNLRAAIPGDSFDGWQNYWNLWWLKTALVDQVRFPYFTDLLYYPTGVGLYFHTLNPINGLLTLPVQLAGGLILAYNAVVLISWTLSGYGVFLLCLWLLAQPATGGSDYSRPNRWPQVQSGAAHLAAFVAGLIYTFAPFHMAHLLGHMQVMGLQWAPLYILFLLRAMRHSAAGRPWLRDALLAGLFLTLNGLSDWYFVLYLFLFTALAVLYHGVVSLAATNLHPKQRLGAFWKPALPPLVAGLLFALLLSPILVPMVREALHYRFMVRPVSDLYILSASLADFLIPNRLHTLFRPESFAWPGNQIAPVSERTISAGYLALALALVAIARRGRQALFWGVAAAFFLLLAMGPSLHLGDITMADVPADMSVDGNAPGWTPFALLNRWIPFMRISRSVSRYAMLVQLCVALLAGMGLYTLMQGRDARARMSIAALAGLVVLGEYWVAPYPISPPDTPAYYHQLADEARPDGSAGAVLNLPMNYDRPGYLLYQTVHQRPLTVAYISRDDPRTLTERVPFLQHMRHLGPDILTGDPASVALTVLADLGVEIVVLDRYKMPGGEERDYTETLARQAFAGQTPLLEDDRLTVFRVEPRPAGERPRPYVELGAENWGPLEERDGVPARRASAGACFTIRHPHEVSAVVLRYAASPETKASVTVAGRQSLVLSPIPQGAIAEIDITDMDETSDAVELCLHPDMSESVWIEAIALR